VTVPPFRLSFTARALSVEMVATRSTALVNSSASSSATRSLPLGITRSYSGKVPSISRETSTARSSVNWMRVGETLTWTSPCSPSISFRARPPSCAAR
jgi:hypothetical protein